jgi:transposase
VLSLYCHRWYPEFAPNLKQFRAIATRYDKTARNFLAAVQLASITIWLN